MSTLRDDVLPIIDDGRALMDELGFRRFDITLRTVAWSGDRVGLGTATTTDTALTLEPSGSRINVKRVSQHDVVASGGLYQDGDYTVGPITPTYTGGGHAVVDFDPAVGANPTEVSFKLVGQGLPSAGAWFRKVAQQVDGNFRYSFTLRALNSQQ